MTTVAWWHCFAGIAGDMALGSLVDAGADLALVERELVGLPIGGWSIEARPVLRAGLACTQVQVRARDTQVVRTHAHIVGLITEARLAEPSPPAGPGRLQPVWPRRKVACTGGPRRRSTSTR